MSSEYGDEARAEVACDRARDAGYLHPDDVVLAAEFTAEQLDSALEAIGNVKIAKWLTSKVRCANCVHLAVCEWHNNWTRQTQDALVDLQGALKGSYTEEYEGPDYLYNLIQDGIAARCRYFKPAAEATEADPAADQHK